MSSVAEALGSTPHLSPLLRRVRRLGLGAPAALTAVAVHRGCTHYSRAGLDGAACDPGRAILGDEELAVAMLSAAQTFDPNLIRCAIQLLGGRAVVPERVLALARQERCLPVLRHAARAALAVDKDNRLWPAILAAKGREDEVPVGRLPHPSRFMAIAGRDRSGSVSAPLWLKPREPSPGLPSS